MTADVEIPDDVDVEAVRREYWNAVLDAICDGDDVERERIFRALRGSGEIVVVDGEVRIEGGS